MFTRLFWVNCEIFMVHQTALHSRAMCVCVCVGVCVFPIGLLKKCSEHITSKQNRKSFSSFEKFPKGILQFCLISCYTPLDRSVVCLLKEVNTSYDKTAAKIHTAVFTVSPKSPSCFASLSSVFFFSVSPQCSLEFIRQAVSYTRVFSV